MLLKIGIVAGAVALCLFTIVSIAVYQAGFLIVDVQSNSSDGHFFAPVPMFAVNLTMDLIPNYRLQQFSTHLLASASLLQQTGKNLNDCPDGVFVEVDQRNQHVRVEKSNGNILIHAITPEQKIFIQVPIASTTRTLTRLVEISESQTEGKREL
jgi:hypothetical protein